MVKKIKHVVLNRPKRMVATNDDPTIGTQENPYTLEEFNWLVLIGEWPGGWVEFFGFVPWNLADWYGSFRAVPTVIALHLLKKKSTQMMGMTVMALVGMAMKMVKMATKEAKIKMETKVMEMQEAGTGIVVVMKIVK